MRESVQAEKARRLTWEREQQAILARFQEANEAKFRAMQEEIDSLKGYIRHIESATTTSSAPPQNPVSESPRRSTPLRDIPQECLSVPGQDTLYPPFIQGSSTDPSPHQSNGIPETIASTSENPTPYTRKRTSSPSSGDDESSEQDEPQTSRPSKRINGHDTRCLTIQVLTW